MTNATSSKVLKFRDGGKAKVGTLPIDRGTIIDKKDRERFKIGEQSIPYRRRNWLGIPVVDRMFFVRENIGDTIPLEIEDLSKAKLTSIEEAQRLEDLAIFESIQETRTGAQEPMTTKMLGAGMLIMFIIAAFVIILWVQTVRGGLI